jgi:hypothetical protein
MYMISRQCLPLYKENQDIRKHKRYTLSVLSSVTLHLIVQQVRISKIVNCLEKDSLKAIQHKIATRCKKSNET